MASGIYKITDIRNKKAYIGRAVDLSNRKWRHFCYIHPERYKSSSLESEKNMRIHIAMNESRNENDFIFEIIEECPEDQLNEKEKYYIKKFNTLYPNGYNSTEGGDSYPHLEGSMHYNHKITEMEASQIKKLLKEGKNAEEIIKEIPNSTMGIISSINNGRSWRDNKISYPISRMNGVIRFTDEEVMTIRRKRFERESVVNLAKEFKTSTGTISSIVLGDTHKNLPILTQRKEKKYTFSNDEVDYFRKQYYIEGKTIKDLHKNFQENISYEAFKSMINGTTYKNCKTYKKELTKNNRDKNKIIERNTKILELNKQNFSKKEIAKIVGCSERTVYRALEKNK